MHITNVHIRRSATPDLASAWSAALAGGSWLAGSKVLKSDGPSWVRRASVHGQDVVIKCRPLDSLGRRIKAAIGQDQFDRHWRAAKLLERAGIACAEPLVLAHASPDGIPCAVLIGEYLEGPTLLQQFRLIAAGEMDVRRSHRLARAAGRFVATLSSALIANRDHKPSNIVVLESASGEIELALIDLVGVRRSVASQAVRMLAAMVIEPTGCGVPPRRALMARALHGWIDGCAEEMERLVSKKLDAQDRRAMFRSAWRDVGKRIREHGDPTPRVLPQ